MTSSRRLRAAVAALAAATALLVSACAASSAPTTGAKGLAEKRTTAGSVEVSATPDDISAEQARFVIALDTHIGSLDVNPAKASTLTVGGRDWPVQGWSELPGGGHHRKGKLTFDTNGDPTGRMVLTIAGLDEPVRFTWSLPDA